MKVTHRTVVDLCGMLDFIVTNILTLLLLSWFIASALVWVRLPTSSIRTVEQSYY